MVLGDPPPGKWQGSPISSFHPIWLVRNTQEEMHVATQYEFATS